jgi:formylglycine-generating enzyme required for sulfatase activity
MIFSIIAQYGDVQMKPVVTLVLIAASFLIPVAYAADQGGAIEMIPIPGRNYEMGKTEVTQGQWKRVMGENPSSFNKCGDDCPVEQVSWTDVKLYIKRLNKKTGQEYRLPSEAEWEYACLAGNQTTYCGGNNVDKVAWTKDNSGGETSSVAGKQPNAWGLYDMSGNVEEWVEDYYDGDNKDRVLRGGSWYFSPQFARAAYRNLNDPAERYNYFGFRLARTLP